VTRSRLIVYGDFNCPYSCLASFRVDVLLAHGLVDVDWRAVDHDPSIASPSRPVEGALEEDLRREVDEVRGLTRSYEGVPIAVPPIQPNTALAASALAAVDSAHRHVVRRRLFEALWFHGRDIGDLHVIRGIVDNDPAAGVPLAQRWRSGWNELDRHLVPMLVLPDGTVSRGLGSLKRLAILAAGS
jgi:predicted DsbA family dithiol-disulfide isomerase